MLGIAFFLFLFFKFFFFNTYVPFCPRKYKAFQARSQRRTFSDLNFVLRSEIFVHYDGQLKVSHLILECNPSNKSYQDPGQALTVGSLLLSYLNVRLRGFLLRGLTLGEARRLGPRQIREGSLLPFRDGSMDQVFHSRVEHIPIDELGVVVPIPVE